MATIDSTILISGVRRRELAALKARAKAKGITVEGYVKELIDSDLSMADLARAATIDQVFKPVQRHFKSSGMSELELDKIIDGARRQNARTTRKKKS